MVITVIALLALIIVVGVMTRKNQEKKDKKHMIEHQILQLTKFKGELMSHHTLEDTFKIHRQLGAMHLAWNPAICPAQYGMFRTSNIATMSMDDVFLGDICGRILLLIGLPVMMKMLLSQLQDNTMNKY